MNRHLTLLTVAMVASTSAVGCARSKPAASPVAQQQEAEPIHDTIQEFRRGERIACAQGTDLVYVVSRDGGLHSFDPTELRFNKIGHLDCPGTRRSLPHSMAVDRSGQAWVGFDNGVISHASITNATCTASQVNVQAAHIGRRFGMGFAPTPQGGIGGETLFLTSEPPDWQDDDGNAGDFMQPAPAPPSRGSRANVKSSVLARIDDGTSISIAGQFPAELRGLRGELSSRSDGRLFAFFTGDPFQIAEIDPATADVRWQKKLEGMRFSQSGTGSWAFAAVGSEFFFFWADRSGPSTVTRLKEDGTLEHVIQNAGMEIVGAGASTCAAKSAKSAALPAVKEDSDVKPPQESTPTPAPIPTPPPPIVVSPTRKPPIARTPTTPPPVTPATPAPSCKGCPPGLPPLPPASPTPRRASPTPKRPPPPPPPTTVPKRRTSTSSIQS